MTVVRPLLCLMLAAAPVAVHAQERPRVGSGVAPAERENSRARPIGFAARVSPGGVLVIPTASGRLPDLSAAGVDAGTRAALERAVADAAFTGAAGSTLTLRGIGPWSRILLVGAQGAGGVRDAVGGAAQELRDAGAPVAIAGGADPQAAALGYALGQYRFDRYKTVGRAAPPTQPVTVLTADPRAADAEWRRRGEALAAGVTLTRDLATEPANVIYPESFVARVRDAFEGVPNVTIEVLDEPAMRRLGMGALLGVGQGSERPSRLMLVRYNGGEGAPLAIVGKGITFDSGGISLKPGEGMWEMKADMTGAATAVGAVLSLALSRAPANVIAVAALAENMPGGNAQRPGDVVRTMSGKTIEVLNTDAEGRLVMADATEYVVDRYRPRGVVTIATLTGSIVRALDDEYAGLFGRDEALVGQVQRAAAATGEPVWRMPLHPNYAADMKSDIADIRNVVEGGGPGAGLAAHFVQFFVPEPTPHAHLDIAGVNWGGGAGATPKGATGWGVRLLDELARSR